MHCLLIGATIIVGLVLFICYLIYFHGWVPAIEDDLDVDPIDENEGYEEDNSEYEEISERVTLITTIRS